MSKRIDISHKTIFFIAGFLALIWVIINIRDLILIIFGAFIIVSAVAPVVEKLVEWKFPSKLAIALVYVSIFVILIGLITLGITPITTQTSSLITQMSNVLTSLSIQYHIDTSALQNQLPIISGNLLTVTFDIFRGFITVVLLVVISIYIMLDKARLENNFAG